jgi:hypothetical protein
MALDGDAREEFSGLTRVTGFTRKSPAFADTPRKELNNLIVYPLTPPILVAQTTVSLAF